MGWKTPKFEYVDGYKFVETDGRTFRVYDGSDEVSEDFPYFGEAAAYAGSLRPRNAQISSNPGPRS